MKTTKKLIMPIISLLMTSVVLVIAITYAWFAFNDHTESRGMDISVKCPANLVITNDTTSWNPGVTELSRGLIPAEGSEDEPVPSVFATTHKSDSPTGLGYLRNSYEIDPATGKVKSTSQSGIILDDVIDSEVNGKYYYIDYTVYVASFGEAFASNTVLAASLINDNENLLNLFNATSVDFYIKASTANDYTFAGTLNLANKDASNNGNTKTEVELNTGTIPLYTDGWFEVILRCYFDGNLNDTATKTYITTNEVNALSTNSVTIGVDIYTK